MDAIVNALIEWWVKSGSLPTTLGGIALVTVLAALWARSKKPVLADIANVENLRGAASGICAWSWKQLVRIVKALDYLSTRREWRYGQPWLLMLGEKSSGKTSLLRSVSMPARQSRPARADELQMRNTEWFFFRKGVLLDPEGKYPAGGAGSSEERNWLKALDDLNALRPERPLDGLVLCVSARTLSRAGQEERETLAASLYRQLAVLQERIDFMLPLTLVVTQCDCIKGFDAFWRSQDKSRRVELFGYSAPAHTQTSAPGDWVDDAFATIKERLRALQVDTAATVDGIDDADDFFLFPGHFQHLHDPLSAFLNTVFRVSAWQAGYLFRGVFFTGSPETDGEICDGAREDVAFADALLSSRVLAESGLAKPTRNGVFSRNALIRKMQYGGVAIVLGLFLMLYFASVRVASQVDALVAAQTQLELTTPEAVRSGDCLQKDSIYPLLSNIARINHSTVYWEIPASWVDRRVIRRSNAGIEDGAIGKVLMPTLACLLEDRSRDLLATGKERASGYLSSRTMLADKLESARKLEDNIARFNKLAEHGDEMSRGELLSVLADLSLYLFDAQLPPEVMNERGALSDGFSGLKSREKLSLPPGMREKLAAQIKSASKALRENLDSEVKRGVSILPLLVKAEPPILSRLRDFSDWLAWIEKSWLMSTVSTNPCEEIRASAREPLETLVHLYGYDSSLMRELSRFDTESCYRREMSALADLRQEPYGALFSPMKAGGLELSERLKSELVGMPEAMQMSFMRLNDAKRFVCQPDSEGFRQDELIEAAGYLREYEAFVEKMKLPPDVKGGTPLLYTRLARLSLSNALGDALLRSQIAPRQSPYQQVSLESVMQADQQLSAMSKELSEGLDQLLAVMRGYDAHGDAMTIPALRQCVRDFASESLSRVAALADSSRLYAPGAAANGDYLYDLGSLPIQKEYLSRQAARAQVLANYAAPFVSLLNAVPSVSDTRREMAQTADFWRNSIDELNRYTQGKEPTGQVANLDNYFIKPLADLTYSNCSKQLAAYQSPSFGNDLFSERRRPLESHVLQRCNNRRLAQAAEVYGALAQRFNRELSGRYPFAEATAPDARSAVVRQFFIDYAQQRPALEEALGELSGERWRAARQFIAELDALAEFFRSNLTAGDSDYGAAIRLRLAFNSQNRPSVGGEQIVAWLLGNGSQSAGIPNRASTLDWQFGETLVLDLSWALQSVWKPVADPQQSDLLVEGNTASFLSGKPWSLLRMIQKHAVTDAASAARGQLLLGFSMPHLREVSSGKSERSRVNLYMGMTLLGIDPKTQAEVKLRLPTKFPRYAPAAD